MQTTSRSVKIGPNFFAGAFRDYSDWKWAWVREIMQNCLDTPRTTEVVAEVWRLNDNTYVSVKNNGVPMTEDVLCNKLLSLGESGKSFQNGSVGGFGKAKEILMMAHESWKVFTGGLAAEGVGGDYLLSSFPYFHGTETTVEIKGDHMEALLRNFRQFAKYSQWAGQLKVNGEILDTNLRKGSRRRDFDWGVVYTNNSFSNLLICRMNGIPMFTQYIENKGTVIIELTGTSSEVLTSNRDSLVYRHQSELNKFVADLAMNSKSALQKNKTERVRFAGYKLGEAPYKTGDHIKVEDSEAVKEMSRVFYNVTDHIKKTDNSSEGQTFEEASNFVSNLFHPEFYIKSEIGGTIQVKFLPGTFSSTNKRLINNWVGILLEIAKLTGSYHNFAVGFVFDKDTSAQHEKHNGQDIVYVNPVTIEENLGKHKLLAKWTATENFELIATAAHEYVHLEGHSYHGEEFANRLTDLMATILKNKARFTKIFQSTNQAF